MGQTLKALHYATEIKYSVYSMFSSSVEYLQDREEAMRKRKKRQG